MVKYSVIIPTYNAEATLERCLDSIVDQNRPDVEVLIINDGSQDRSSEICHQYIERFPYIKVFEKENGGVSSARNLGLDRAQGIYILFVDSDDYVDAAYFSSLDAILSDNQTDLAMFGTQFFGGRNHSTSIEDGMWHGDHVSDTVCSWIYANLFYSLWSKAFRRDLIEQNRIRFDKRLAISEDVAFIFSYAVHAKQVVSNKDVLYYVSEENNQSLSRKKIEKLEDQLTHALEVMRTSLTNASLSKHSYLRFADSLTFLNYRSAYSVAKQTKTISDPHARRKAIRQICTRFSQYPLRPFRMKSLLIALPIKLKCVRMIDILIQRKR